MNMQNFENIHNLWKADKGESLPDAREMIMQIKKAHKKMIRRYIVSIVILFLTFLFIGFIGWHYHFEHWTTRVGIIITLVTIILGIFFNTKLVQLLLRQGDLALDNRSFLEQLIRFRNIQHTVKSKGIALYFILLSIGIALYMVEFAERNIYFGIGAYAITFCWIAFAWFYIRKKEKNKAENEINQQIENLKRMMKEMDEE